MAFDNWTDPDLLDEPGSLPVFFSKNGCDDPYFRHHTR